jgi:recombination protein RecA
MANKYKKNPPELFTGDQLPPVEWISTGILGYDWVNGGGAPMGHIEQIYGKRSSGKTTLTLRKIAEAQRSGKLCAFFDLEHTLDRDWARKHGVVLEDLVIHSPYDEAGETTLTVVEQMLISAEFGLIAIDSVNAIIPRAMMDATLEDKFYGGNSGLLEQFFKRIIGPGILYNSNTHLVMINQPRALIGSRFGGERLPGGNSLQHYSSIINETKAGDYILVGPKEDAEKIGQEIKVINHKNKVRWPYREQTLRLHFAKGFNPLFDVIQFAIRYDLIEMNGSWAYYDGQNMGQGIQNQMQWLVENKEVYFELKKQIIEIIRSGK